MKLAGTTCYSHLLYIMCAGEPLQHSVYSITFKSPNFSGEGFNGYIETSYEIEVKDIEKFSKLWTTWYSLSGNKRLDLYGLAKGLGDCK